MGISSYSTTPGSNTTINGINIAEGCPPSGINDAIRQLMADIVSGVQLAQAPTATGAANAIVVTLSPVIASYSGGQRITFIPASDNTGATTINYGGGVINLQKWGGIALVATDIVSGVAADVLHDGTRAILMNPQTYTQGANIASAGTINLDAATGDYNHITGTTTITAITLKQGRERTIVFDGALTFTNGASLILPGGANITTAAGDAAIVRGEASSVVRCTSYVKANGQAVVVPASVTDATIAVSDVTTNNVSSSAHGWAPKSPADATQFLNGANPPAYSTPAVSTLVAPTAFNSATTFAVTGLPTGIKKLFIYLNGVTFNATSDILIQIGNATDTLKTSGYLVSGTSAFGGTVGTNAYTAGFGIRSATASTVISGMMELDLVDSSNNKWVGTGSFDWAAPANAICAGSQNNMSAVLDRFTVTTVGGTATWTAGSISYSYSK